jgi:hypothetical protein
MKDMMTKHAYFPSFRDDERRKKSVDKARKRGEVASEWLKTNKLTKETQSQFNALMKATDKEFDNNH